jgi:hypothetical protein
MAMETPQRAVPDDRIGKAIGHHIVRGQLGDGGMGSVHVAEPPAAPAPTPGDTSSPR